MEFISCLHTVFYYTVVGYKTALDKKENGIWFFLFALVIVYS
jgi:hypothetical protein